MQGASRSPTTRQRHGSGIFTVLSGLASQTAANDVTARPNLSSSSSADCTKMTSIRQRGRPRKRSIPQQRKAANFSNQSSKRASDGASLQHTDDDVSDAKMPRLSRQSSAKKLTQYEKRASLGASLNGELSPSKPPKSPRGAYHVFM